MRYSLKMPRLVQYFVVLGNLAQIFTAFFYWLFNADYVILILVT
ncbi:hypothetical protein T06_1161 [Trichinella sp. T6]|nr:hypothetical protein T06_1161 [Trichinella sp. T6]